LISGGEGERDRGRMSAMPGLYRTFMAHRGKKKTMVAKEFWLENLHGKFGSMEAKKFSSQGAC